MGKNRVFLIIIVLILSLCCSVVQGTASNILRIEKTDGWVNYLEIPQGATSNLVVLTTKEGSGVLIDQYPDGSEHNHSHYFLRNDRIPFNAYTQGRHVLSYVVDDKKSNPVVIDVPPADCYDGNPCTIDRCGPNCCVHTPANCDDQNPCTIDTCGPNGCVHAPVNCDDSNACTADTCDPATGCVYTPISCDDQNPCTVDTCGPEGCVHAPELRPYAAGSGCLIRHILVYGGL